MILMGDEVRRTQNGNNNDYCHDDEIELVRLVAARRSTPTSTASCSCSARRALLRTVRTSSSRLTLNQLIRGRNKSWHGVKLDQPDWGDASHSIAFTAELKEEPLLVHLIFNAYWEPLDFELPQGRKRAQPARGGGGSTRRSSSPQDIVPWQDAPPVPGERVSRPRAIGRRPAEGIVMRSCNMSTSERRS